MLRYYFSIALRHALRSKLYSLISVTGLAMGLCASLIIGIYVNDELSYDSWIPDADNIYRVAPLFRAARARAGPSDLGLWLRQDYQQITEVTRAFPRILGVSKDDLKFNETILWVDSNFFDVFDYPVVTGDLHTALIQPSNIVVTETVAEKYFNTVEAVGQSILFDNEYPMRIAAVIRDLPSNTTMNPTIFAPGHAIHSALLEQDQNPVMNYFGAKLWAVFTYIKVTPEVSVAAIEADLDAMMDRRLPISEGQKNGEIYDLEILPLQKLHLAPADFTQGETDMSGIYTVIAIGFLILLAACTNYVNLMTAKGMKRSQEIAIRKTVGASRNNLVLQFLAESSLFVICSLLLAILLCYLLLPPFNSFLQREIAFGVFADFRLLSSTAGLAVITILFAGLYPAIVLSGFTPLQNLQSSRHPRRRFLQEGLFRTLLSVVQFAILTGLMIATYTIYQQSQFGIRQAMNQTEDPVVILTTTCDEPLKRALALLPEVRGVACAGQIPQWGMGVTVAIRSQADNTRDSVVHYTSVDVNFFELFNLELLAGRHFEEERTADQIRDEQQFESTTAIIINETLMRALDFDSAGDALGEIFTWSRMYQRPSRFSPQHQVEIIGVLKDFQIGNIRQATPPAGFYVQRDQSTMMAIQIDGNSVAQALEGIDAVWDAMDTGRPISRQFYDEVVENIYQSITRQAGLLSIYALVAVAIAVLGLVGLATFVAEKRTKEIGIRKVLGGSRTSIITLLLWQFSRPVLISNIIAWPVAYYFLSIWLQGFERHIDLSAVAFIVAGFATFALAMLTVFMHAFLVAGTAPVSALRYE